MLQWGRNLIVAEGAPRRGVGNGRNTASMGPQLDSCGRKDGEPDKWSMNKLQWGRNLIVAEG